MISLSDFKQQRILDLSTTKHFLEVDAWKNDNHVFAEHVLAGMEFEISVTCSDNWDRLILVKFFGVNGKWYLPELNMAVDGNFTLHGKYKDKPRIYVERAAIDSHARINGAYEYARRIAEVENAIIIEQTYIKLYELLAESDQLKIDCIPE